MNPLLIVPLLVGDLLFVLVAVVLGETVILLGERVVRSATGAPPSEATAPSVARLGAVALVGMGCCSYVGVVLGLAHAFGPLSLAAVAVLSVAVGRSTLARWWTWLRARPWRATLRNDRVCLGAGAIAAGLFLGNLQAAFMPPVFGDILSYHLPQARLLADGHTLPLTIGGHYWYGNIPKLVEVLFAEGLAFDGTSLADLLHMTILGGFLLLLFGVVRDWAGPRTALVTLVLVLSYTELMENASTAYIDAAVVCFEVGAVLCVFAWVHRRRAEDLAQAALLIGLSLASKYSSGPTLLFLGAVVLLILLRDGAGVRVITRLALALGGLVLVACGFWYVKNAVRYGGNPVYPLYFGHPGVTDAQVKGIVDDIHQFGPRDPGHFLAVPGRFLDAKAFPAFLALAGLPVVLLVSRLPTRLRWGLGAYVVFYISDWFWVTSSQTRFVMSGVVVAFILLAGLIVWAIERVPRGETVIAVLAVVIVAAWVPLGKFRVAALRHTFGLQSTDQVLADEFGCQYRVVQYVNDHDLRGNVVDDWSLPFDNNVAYYSEHARFRTLDPARDDAGVRAQVRRDDLRYVYWKGANLQSWLTRPPDPKVLSGREGPDALVRRGARVVYRDGDCTLARIA